VGDAAYSVDPLSGGGIRRAVETALEASDAIAAFFADDSQAFDRYDRWAASDFERWLSDKNGVHASAAPELLVHPFWHRRISALVVA
jgi:flavin-dependent dehydrogenase